MSPKLQGSAMRRLHGHRRGGSGGSSFSAYDPVAAAEVTKAFWLGLSIPERLALFRFTERSIVDRAYSIQQKLYENELACYRNGVHFVDRDGKPVISMGLQMFRFFWGDYATVGSGAPQALAATQEFVEVVDIFDYIQKRLGNLFAGGKPPFGGRSAWASAFETESKAWNEYECRVLRLCEWALLDGAKAAAKAATSTQSEEGDWSPLSATPTGKALKRNSRKKGKKSGASSPFALPAAPKGGASEGGDGEEGEEGEASSREVSKASPLDDLKEDVVDEHSDDDEACERDDLENTARASCETEEQTGIHPENLPAEEDCESQVGLGFVDGSSGITNVIDAESLHECADSSYGLGCSGAVCPDNVGVVETSLDAIAETDASTGLWHRARARSASPVYQCDTCYDDVSERCPSAPPSVTGSTLTNSHGPECGISSCGTLVSREELLSSVGMLKRSVSFRRPSRPAPVVMSGWMPNGLIGDAAQWSLVKAVTQPLGSRGYSIPVLMPAERTARVTVTVRRTFLTVVDPATQLPDETARRRAKSADFFTSTSASASVSVSAPVGSSISGLATSTTGASSTYYKATRLPWTSFLLTKNGQQSSHSSSFANVKVDISSSLAASCTSRLQPSQPSGSSASENIMMRPKVTSTTMTTRRIDTPQQATSSLSVATKAQSSIPTASSDQAQGKPAADTVITSRYSISSPATHSNLQRSTSFSTEVRKPRVIDHGTTPARPSVSAVHESLQRNSVSAIKSSSFSVAQTNAAVGGSASVTAIKPSTSFGWGQQRTAAQTIVTSSPVTAPWVTSSSGTEVMRASQRDIRTSSVVASASPGSVSAAARGKH